LTLDLHIGPLSASANPDWIDFIGGVRGQQYLSQTVFVEGMTLAGLGGSDFVWDVYGVVGYSFSPNFSVSAGYRGLGVDY
jgi:hypothetical protein